MPGILVVFALLAKNLVRGAIGREWMAIRDMDVAAAVIGIRPDVRQAHRLRGQLLHRRRGRALWGFVHLGSWEPAAFSVDRSFQLLFMVIIGGLGRSWAAFFGAAFIVVLPIVLNNCCLGRRLVRHRGSTPPPSHPDLHDLRRLIVFFLIVEPHGWRACGPSAREAAPVAFPCTDSPHFWRTVFAHPGFPAFMKLKFPSRADRGIAAAGGRSAPAFAQAEGAVLPLLVLPHRPVRAQRHALGQRLRGLPEDDQRPWRHQRREDPYEECGPARHRPGRGVLRAPEGQAARARCSSRCPPASPSR